MIKFAGFHGGFTFTLDLERMELVVDSSSRMEGGSEQRHVIDR